MEVFISWSGEPSHKLALILKDWISNVIQTVDPWVSSEDIEKGDRWSTEIADKLDTCNIGIICLTKENFQAPWINFEAGALSKKLGEGKVCTLLLDLKPTDIKGPLIQFQATIAKNKEDMRKLINSINGNLQDNKLRDNILSQAFEMWWEKYFQKVEIILPVNMPQAKSKQEKVRTNEDLLEEILSSIRELRNSASSRDAIEMELITSQNAIKASMLNEQIKELKKELNNLLESREIAYMDIKKLTEEKRSLEIELRNLKTYIENNIPKKIAT